jgi:hypothetical protein
MSTAILVGEVESNCVNVILPVMPFWEKSAIAVSVVV